MEMEPEWGTKVEGVKMAMSALDCPVCYKPLAPPIYQCGVGHLICKSCRVMLKQCPLCPRTAFERCFGMDRVVASIEVPCCFSKYGCTKKMAYFNKQKHENECPQGRCFCPESGCGFTGPPMALSDHFTTHHRWPSTSFKYYKQFDLRIQPGPHVLRGPDGNIFLMRVVPVFPLGQTISLVQVQPKETNYKFGCSVVFSCFTGHHQISNLDDVPSSSLSDMPKYFCVVPGGGAGVILKITIDTELMHDDDDELEEEDDEDESYDEDEDEDVSDDDY